MFSQNMQTALLKSFYCILFFKQEWEKVPMKSAIFITKTKT